MNRKRQQPRRKASRAPTTTTSSASDSDSHLPLDAESAAYMSRLAEDLNALNVAQQSWTRENEELINHPEAVEDSAWRARAQAAMDGIVFASARLALKPVPARMAGVGSLMGKVADNARAMASDYAVALSAHDSSAMRSMKSHSTKIFNYIKQAQARIPR